MARQEKAGCYQGKVYLPLITAPGDAGRTASRLCCSKCVRACVGCKCTEPPGASSQVWGEARAPGEHAILSPSPPQGSSPPCLSPHGEGPSPVGAGRRQVLRTPQASRQAFCSLAPLSPVSPVGSVWVLIPNKLLRRTAALCVCHQARPSGRVTVMGQTQPAGKAGLRRQELWDREGVISASGALFSPSE